MSTEGTTVFNFSAEEEKTLAYWREIDAFQTSLLLSKDKPAYTFYDGPPFATGLPHYGHILAGTIKDVVTRFAHQTGHFVERRFGWDCHGLPIEFEVDTEYGIKTKQQVLDIGIKEYNHRCRSIVMRYAQQWRETVERSGRWIDFDNDYKTMNPSFMESVWWVFKQLFEKDQVYRGFKVMPYSNGCKTPLANFEASQNYKEVIDPAVVVSFPLVEDPKTAVLAWTTTPWTLPANVALCVHPQFDYIKILDEVSGDQYILAEARLEILYKNPAKAAFKILQKYKGTELVGKKYIPLFDYFQSEYGECGFKVVADEYVTNDSGTGIVHQAPAFGEDDNRVCLREGITKVDAGLPCPLDEDGKFIAPVRDYEGLFLKDADKLIQKTLKANGRLIRQSQVSHQYPFCWRSDTPLIYKAVPSWFVRVRQITDKLLANNLKSKWVPDFVQEKRFANWLENARDWNVSRNRFWGTPIPLWTNVDFSEVVCVGSVEELKRLSGRNDIVDLHRDSIDDITIPAANPNDPPLRRIEEVFDCWFESGSMPYAQQHYPFENAQKFESTFPADFCAEGLDQTRGWFYTLLVLSTHLFDQPPFKNLIVNGLVLASYAFCMGFNNGLYGSDGRKMSKRLKNYVPVNDIMDKYGADPLRLYLINSPVVRAEPLRFVEDGVKEVVTRVLLPWFNAFKFFTNQVVLVKKELGLEFRYQPDLGISENVMDRWILARCQSLIEFVRREMNNYRLYTVIPRLLNLIEELTNWYVRFNRRRLKGEGGEKDCTFALNTLFEVLYTLVRTMAPFTPFLTEHMYQTLKGFLPVQEDLAKSVHFLDFPTVREEYFNQDIERRVSRMQAVIELSRNIREKHTVGLKTPLKELIVVHSETQYLEDLKALEGYIQEELNVRQVRVTSDEEAFGIKYQAQVDFRVLGQKLKKDVMRVKNALPSKTPLFEFYNLSGMGVELSSEEIKNALGSGGGLTVDGIILEATDVTISRAIDEDRLKLLLPGYFANCTKDLVVLLDLALHPELVLEGVQREVVNRVQRLRKKVGLLPTDEVEMFYEILKDEQGQLVKALQDGQQTLVVKVLKKQLEPMTKLGPGREVITQEEQEVGNAVFLLRLVK